MSHDELQKIWGKYINLKSLFWLIWMVDGAQELIGQYLFSRLIFIMRVYAEVVNLRASRIAQRSLLVVFFKSKSSEIG